METGSEVGTKSGGREDFLRKPRTTEAISAVASVPWKWKWKRRKAKGPGKTLLLYFTAAATFKLLYNIMSHYGGGNDSRGGGGGGYGG